MSGPTTNPIGKAIACAVVAFIAIYAGLWLSFGTPSDPARIAGIIAGMVVVPAIIVGLWARKSAKAWSLLRLIALYVVFLVIVAVLFTIGSVSNPPH
jgi:hypothetical protein